MINNGTTVTLCRLRQPRIYTVQAVKVVEITVKFGLHVTGHFIALTSIFL